MCFHLRRILDWDLGVCLQYECKRKQLHKPDVLNSWIDLRSTYRVSAALFVVSFHLLCLLYYFVCSFFFFFNRYQKTSK